VSERAADAPLPVRIRMLSKERLGSVSDMASLAVVESGVYVADLETGSAGRSPSFQVLTCPNELACSRVLMSLPARPSE
jgi:hypothetical protein